MGKNVNPELYEFLKKNDAGLYRKSHKGRKEIIVDVIGYVHIDFEDLSEFVEIIGTYFFEEGGMAVQMFDNSICIEINDFIEDLGQRLSDYKNCFNESDWKEYEAEIKQMEAE